MSPGSPSSGVTGVESGRALDCGLSAVLDRLAGCLVLVRSEPSRPVPVALLLLRAGALGCSCVCHPATLQPHSVPSTRTLPRFAPASRLPRTRLGSSHFRCASWPAACQRCVHPRAPKTADDPGGRECRAIPRSPVARRSPSSVLLLPDPAGSPTSPATCLPRSSPRVLPDPLFPASPRPPPPMRRPARHALPSRRHPTRVLVLTRSDPARGRGRPGRICGEGG